MNGSVFGTNTITISPETLDSILFEWIEERFGAIDTIKVTDAQGNPVTLTIEFESRHKTRAD